jgi:hypothetical protein
MVSHSFYRLYLLLFRLAQYPASHNVSETACFRLQFGLRFSFNLPEDNKKGCFQNARVVLRALTIEKVNTNRHRKRTFQ